MLSPEEMSMLYESSYTFNALGENHGAVSDGVKTQAIVVGNTTEQLVAGYTIYGLEAELEAESMAQADVPGVTTEPSGLADPDPEKLVPQPELGNSLDERMAHFGHHPPVASTADGIALTGDTAQPGVGSILPWTPHPQHSYKDNSTRVLNRTGRQRPRPNT